MYLNYGLMLRKYCFVKALADMENERRTIFDIRRIRLKVLAFWPANGLAPAKIKYATPKNNVGNERSLGERFALYHITSFSYYVCVAY